MAPRRPIASLALAIALAPSLLAAQNPPRPSNTAYAERMVQIIWDADAPPPDINGVLDRLLSEQGMAPLVEKALGAKPKPGRSYAWHSPKLDVADHSCTVGLVASVDHAAGERPAATELADALVGRLAGLLCEDRSRDAQQRTAQLREEVANLQFEIESRRRQVRQKAAEMFKNASRADMSVATLEAGIGKLEDERQRIELDLAGMEARLEAVQEQIDRATVLAAKAAETDPVIPELEKAVAAREKLAELTRRQAEAGNVDARELPKAEAELVEAKVQLLDRRSAAGARGGDALAPLTREMQNLAIDIRDRKARLAYAQKRLASVRDIALEFQELRAIEKELEGLDRSWEDANGRLREAQHKVEVARVDRVIVINSSDRAAPKEGAQ